MDRVHSVQTMPLTEVDPVAIAIGITAPNQRHVGVLHKDEDSQQLFFLHLRWHHKLANDLPVPEFVWVNPAIHPKRLVQVAAICRKIWRANQSGGIPYAFSPPNDCFDDESGVYLFGPTRHGLTCATFVLAIFHQAGLQLVNYASWPSNRPGDPEWQSNIVSLLQRTGATGEHLEAVKAEIGSVRYRPEEVAGAATITEIPADFPIVSERGAGILARLQSHSCLDGTTDLPVQRDN